MGRLNNESVKLCMLKGIVPDTDKVCKHKVCHFYVNNATNPNNKLHAETTLSTSYQTSTTSCFSKIEMPKQGPMRAKVSL